MLCTAALLSLLVVAHSQQPFIFGPGVVEPGIIIIGPGGPIGPPPPFMPGPPPQQHHRPTTSRPRPTTTTRRPTTTTPRPTTSKPSSNQNGLSCGFKPQLSATKQPACTRKAEFRVSIDGTMTTATCSVSGNSRVRCEGCCQARGLAAGLSTEHTAGFPSNNGVDCICCFNREC